MKISEILFKEFKHAPTLSEFVDFITSEEWYEGFMDSNKWADNQFEEYTLYLLNKYNNFLKQPIELGMLVPCKDGEVLEEPSYYKTYHKDYKKLRSNNKIRECMQYQKAKEGVLFSGLIKDTDVTGELFIADKRGNIKFFEGDKVEISDLTGQPITEHYFKFLD